MQVASCPHPAGAACSPSASSACGVEPARAPTRSPWYKLTGAKDPKGDTDGGRRGYAPLRPGDRDQPRRPEDRRVAFVDDYGGKIELSTQQLRNLITLLVPDEF